MTSRQLPPGDSSGAGALSVLRQNSSLAKHLRVDVSRITPVVGAITAIPLITVFVVGLWLTSPRTAVAMAIGANLIAVVSLVGAPRLSIRLALLDAFAMGVAVFLGTITGPWPWLHILIMVPWCFGAGLLVVFGQTQATIGSQAIIAYVVLGRFAGSAGTALHLSLCVVIGALVEVLALVVLRLPPSLRHQRALLAAAFEAVGELADSEAARPATDLLSALDEADLALASPSLFSRTDVQDLRAILDQARRIRLELTTIAGLRLRLPTNEGSRHDAMLRACLHQVALTCDDLGACIRRTDSDSWRERIHELRALLASAAEILDNDPVESLVARQCIVHLNSISGQLRAVGSLIVHLRTDNDRHVWRPVMTTFGAPDFDRMLFYSSVLKSSLHRDSSSFRHAVRLGVAVPFSYFVGSALGLPRSYWLPFAVAVILKPDYSTLVKRGLGRLVGTLMGASLAAVLVSELHPSLVGTALLVAVIGWIAYSTWAASFPVAIGFITSMVLILLSTSTTDTIGTALDRLLDVSLGGIIAVVAYIVWPTSPRAGVSEAEGQLFAALEQYLSVVSDEVCRRRESAGRVLSSSKNVRQAWARAEAAVGRSIEEPAATRIDPSEGRGLLSVTMRILRATHAMRIEAELGVTVNAFPELDDLFGACLGSLTTLSNRLLHGVSSEVKDLRALYDVASKVFDEEALPETIALHLDELVNAINTAQHILLVGPSATA